MPQYKFRYTFLKIQWKQNERDNGQQKNLSEIQASEKCPTFIKIRMKSGEGKKKPKSKH